MTIDGLFEAIDGLLEAIAPLDYPQTLDADYFGSCPCFDVRYVIDGQLLSIWGRCWRVSEDDEEQDLYVWGDFPTVDLGRVAEALKAKLDAQEWYSPYRIILHELDWNRV